MTASIRPCRSLLYVPAINARAVDKARVLSCDGVILDLEDSVGPEAKEEARAAAVAALGAGGFGHKIVAVRCNALSTPWGAQDLMTLTAAGAEVLVLPKVDGPQAVLDAEGLTDGVCDLWAMVETCQAVLDLSALAAISGHTRLSGLMLGTNDLAAEMHCRPGPGREPLWHALSATVTAARAHGLLALDGTFNTIGDEEGLAAQCRQGADFGFDGKTLIHPSQIAPANAAFSPAVEELAWARAVIAAYDAEPEAGVLKVDGRMTERLHLAQAHRLVARAAT